MKICSACKANKPLCEFNKYHNGFQPMCKKCQKLYNSSPEARAVRRAYKLKMRYGITFEDYDKLLLSQSGVCMVCLNPPPNDQRLDIDHDHSCCPGEKTCGKCIRGLLCRRCNATLGMVGDDIELLHRFIEYLGA